MTKAGCCEQGYETSKSIIFLYLSLFNPLCYNNNKKAKHVRRTAVYLKSGNQLHVSTYSYTIIVLYIEIKRKHFASVIVKYSGSYFKLRSQTSLKS